MTRNEIAVEVYNRVPPYFRSKFTQEFVKRIVKLTFEVIREGLLNGEVVSIQSFGSFTPRAYQSRKSWSHTKKILVDSRKWLKIYFRMGKGMKTGASIKLNGDHWDRTEGSES